MLFHTKSVKTSINSSVNDYLAIEIIIYVTIKYIFMLLITMLSAITSKSRSKLLQRYLPKVKAYFIETVVPTQKRFRYLHLGQIDIASQEVLF